MHFVWFQLAVVRQVLRREIGLKIVEVESDKANVEGGDVLWTGILLILHYEECYKWSLMCMLAALKL